MSNSKRRVLFSTTLVAAILAVPGFAQEKGGELFPDKPKVAATKEPVVYLTAWPKPADKDALLVDIERLVKARTPEMEPQAHDALLLAGASAVPFLLERYGREKDVDALKRLKRQLVEMVAAGHTRLLAKHFESKYMGERTMALWRAAGFPDKELLPAAEAALARVEKQGDKADPEERYAAALCATSTGSTKGLEVLFDISVKSWDKRGKEIRAALEGTRSDASTAVLLKKLESADRNQKVAALRMLAGCGVKSSASSVKPYLDESDNSIRCAAINALLGIVEGAPPLDDLSAFQAIEEAKKWKGKL